MAGWEDILLGGKLSRRTAGWLGGQLARKTADWLGVQLAG